MRDVIGNKVMNYCENKKDKMNNKITEKWSSYFLFLFLRNKSVILHGWQTDRQTDRQRKENTQTLTRFRINIQTDREKYALNLWIITSPKLALFSLEGKNCAKMSSNICTATLINVTFYTTNDLFSGIQRIVAY